MITLFISIQKEFVRDFDPGGWRGRERGVRWISSDGDDRGMFLGLKITIPGFVWVGKFGEYFLGIQNNLKNRGRVVLRKLKPNLASGIRHGIFGGLIFGPGIFLGFDVCPRHLKSVVPRGDFGASKRRSELGGCSNYT